MCWELSDSMSEWLLRGTVLVVRRALGRMVFVMHCFYSKVRQTLFERCMFLETYWSVI